MVRLILALSTVALAVPTAALAGGVDGEVEPAPEVAAPAAAPAPATVEARAAPPKRGKRNLITVGPTVVPLGVNARYQRRLVPHVSAFVGAGLGGSTVEIEGQAVALRRTKIEAGLDLHPLGRGMRRLYLGPRVNQRAWSATVEGETLELKATSVEAMLGWRWVGPKGLSAGVGLGAGYATPVASSTLTGDTELPIWSGWGPRGEANVGFAF